MIKHVAVTVFTYQCEGMDEEEEEEDADFYPGWCTAGSSQLLLDKPWWRFMMHQ